MFPLKPDLYNVVIPGKKAVKFGYDQSNMVSGSNVVAYCISKNFVIKLLTCLHPSFKLLPSYGHIWQLSVAGVILLDSA